MVAACHAADRWRHGGRRNVGSLTSRHVAIQSDKPAIRVGSHIGLLALVGHAGTLHPSQRLRTTCARRVRVAGRKKRRRNSRRHISDQPDRTSFSAVHPRKSEVGTARCLSSREWGRRKSFVKSTNWGQTRFSSFLRGRQLAVARRSSRAEHAPSRRHTARVERVSTFDPWSDPTVTS